MTPQDILNATVEQRKTFTNLVSSATNLQMVEIPGWAGLGGVRYLADLWLDQETFNPANRADINALNVHLVSQLKATDSAFSLGGLVVVVVVVVMVVVVVVLTVVVVVVKIVVVVFLYLLNYYCF